MQVRSAYDAQIKELDERQRKATADHADSLAALRRTHSEEVCLPPVTP